MKTFEHEWILEEFKEHPTFYTKGMFGGLAMSPILREAPYPRVSRLGARLPESQ